MDFLAEFLDVGCRYNTEGLHWSTLPALHDPIQDTRIDEHPHKFVILPLGFLIENLHNQSALLSGMLKKF